LTPRIFGKQFHSPWSSSYQLNDCRRRRTCVHFAERVGAFERVCLPDVSIESFERFAAAADSRSERD